MVLCCLVLQLCVVIMQQGHSGDNSSCFFTHQTKATDGGSRTAIWNRRATNCDTSFPSEELLTHVIYSCAAPPTTAAVFMCFSDHRGFSGQRQTHWPSRHQLDAHSGLTCKSPPLCPQAFQRNHSVLMSTTAFQCRAAPRQQNQHALVCSLLEERRDAVA